MMRTPSRSILTQQADVPHRAYRNDVQTASRAVKQRVARRARSPSAVAASAQAQAGDRIIVERLLGVSRIYFELSQ